MDIIQTKPVQSSFTIIVANVNHKIDYFTLKYANWWSPWRSHDKGVGGTGPFGHLFKASLPLYKPFGPASRYSNQRFGERDVRHGGSHRHTALHPSGDVAAAIINFK